jgi:hypothetical protein
MSQYSLPQRVQRYKTPLLHHVRPKVAASQAEAGDSDNPRTPAAIADIKNLFMTSSSLCGPRNTLTDSLQNFPNGFSLYSSLDSTGGLPRGLSIPPQNFVTRRSSDPGSLGGVHTRHRGRPFSRNRRSSPRPVELQHAMRWMRVFIEYRVQ